MPDSDDLSLPTYAAQRYMVDQSGLCGERAATVLYDDAFAFAQHYGARIVMPRTSVHRDSEHAAVSMQRSGLPAIQAVAPYAEKSPRKNVRAVGGSTWIIPSAACVRSLQAGGSPVSSDLGGHPNTAHTRRQWRAVRSAWISTMGFPSIMFCYFGVNLWISGLHSYKG